MPNSHLRSRRIIRPCLIPLLLITIISFRDSGRAGADEPAHSARPNVVWIVSEDNSHHYLSHFFPGGAAAPNIEAMAAKGLTFDHAFSNAPVCSVARTTLATGCYGPRIGTQFHRRSKLAAMPPGLRMFPAYLRDAGYFTTNNSKKDYNAVEGEGVWDESSRTASWRNRPDSDQPFFHMASHSESHEGRLHFSRASMKATPTKTDAESVALPPYHPDTEIFRYTHAFYRDKMMVIDDIVGDTIAKLKEDGQLENTFVFYFGDHGGVLPRGKGYIYESGLHVPLVVRVPENFKNLVGQNSPNRGERIGGFVEFVDFGPTVLSLAGLDVPEQVDGKPFLGGSVDFAEVNSRNESFGYADRFDEKYDLIRSVRVGKYQYIRNFQPYLPDGLMNIYRYKSIAFNEWRDLYDSGKLSAEESQFFRRRPVEQLFDCDADPHQVNDLSGNPDHREALLELRANLNARLTSMPDLSLFPESHLVNHALGNPVEFGSQHKQQIAAMLDIANLVFQPTEDATSTLRKMTKSDDAMDRYWAAMTATAIGRDAESLADDIRPLLKDPVEVVQIRAAEFLGMLGQIDPRETLVPLVNTTDDPVVTLEALNAVVWFRDFFDDRYPVERSDFHPKSTQGEISSRLNYINGVPYPAKANRRRKKQ